MIEAMERVDGMFVISLESDAGRSAERLAESLGVPVQDVVLALLRLYAADARIGDDHRIGSGAFADAVDEGVLDLTVRQPECDWVVLLSAEAAPALADCFNAHAYSRFARSLDTSGELEQSHIFVNKRIGAVAQSCIQRCHQSNDYLAVLADTLGDTPGIVVQKEMIWAKWQAAKKPGDAPEKLQKYLMGRYVEKLLEFPNESLDVILENAARLSADCDAKSAIAMDASEEMEVLLAAWESVEAEVGAESAEATVLADELDCAWVRYCAAMLAVSSADDKFMFGSNRLEYLNEPPDQGTGVGACPVGS